MDRPIYIDWIVEEKGITIKDGIPIRYFRIDYKEDDTVLDNWVLHMSTDVGLNVQRKALLQYNLYRRRKI